jgi:predicted nucleic acid-binding protein
VQKYLERSPDEVAAFTTRFRRMAILVEPQFTLEEIEDDPAGNCVLECAVAGGASYIVSGDGHLLRLKEYKEIVVLRPTELLTLLDLT